VRLPALALLLACCLINPPAGAQEKIVQTFSGTGSQMTPAFTVGDKWEVRWDSSSFISISLHAADGTLTGGTAGLAQGSIYAPKGGSYYLQINSGSAAGDSPWHVTVVEVGATSPGDLAKMSVNANYVPPPAAPPSTNATPSLTFTPTPPALPQLIHTPATDPSIPRGLTPEQAQALVLIKGDFGEGTGFLAKTKDGPAVITNLHVIAANPHLQILTAAGAQIKTTRFQGASDRDLAMFLIQDDHYSYLNLADLSADDVQTYDDVVTPGNSEGGEVMLNTKGTILGIGPEKVEISNPIYHGNSGGPVFHLKSGKVVGVVTEGMKVRPSDWLDKASAANADSAISGTVRYFALRLDDVPNWETYDMDGFLAQTTFLKNFHEQSRAIDSYLNGAQYDKAGVSSPTAEGGPPTARYYLNNDKIRGFADDFHQLVSGSDNSQKLDAQRELLMNLQGQADADLATIQNSGNFYSFEAQQAKHELAYRMWLKDELEKIGDKISDLGH
jgi:hypothetical protein